jgi:alpha-1,3-rhamnosyl/mannosyltransferase
VGTVEPRKNIATLLDAWERLRTDVRDEYDLVVAGPAGWGDSAVLKRLQAGTTGVRYLGYVAEADLPALTAGASAFVYPSLYEGFGLPLAQAMAAGRAAVTSAVSSMPEVAGGAALLVDPKSVEELGSAMDRLLSDAPLRNELGRRGRARADRFRWEEGAARSWEFFEEVMGRA